MRTAECSGSDLRPFTVLQKLTQLVGLNALMESNYHLIAVRAKHENDHKSPGLSVA